MQRLIYTNTPHTEIDAALASLQPEKVFVLVDNNTRRLVLPRLAEHSRAIADAQVIEILAGDDHKDLRSLTHIWNCLVNEGATRKSVLVNLGGGMVTDIGGFAAACFKRGMRFVNIPTTLLGAVDASVGGKTGINFHDLKNEIGAFREAETVIISTCFFSTLPAQELISGYAEVLKHALLKGENETNEALAMTADRLSSDEMLSLLERSVEVKRRIVQSDPYERGPRKALNLGHTPAHAFEAYAFAEARPMAHGHAVAWGLVVDLILSHLIKQFPSDLLSRVAAFVKENYPAPDFTCDDYPRLIEYMRHDKKNRSADAINFTLLCRPGVIAIDETVDPDTIRVALDIFRDLLQ